jgi:glycerol-3-phosphate acyltransferase PlsY
MESIFEIIFYIIFSYLLGSVLLGYFIARLLKKKDFGKKDLPGTAGTFRQLGLIPAFLVLLFDFIKGFLVPWVGTLLGLPQLMMIVASFAVISGHNWPLFFGFSKGGGGIITSLGAAIFLFPREAIIALCIAVLGVILYQLWIKKIFPISKSPFPFAMAIGVIVLIILALFFKKETSFLIFALGLGAISLIKLIQLKLKEK